MCKIIVSVVSRSVCIGNGKTLRRSEELGLELVLLLRSKRRVGTASCKSDAAARPSQARWVESRARTGARALCTALAAARLPHGRPRCASASGARHMLRCEPLSKTSGVRPKAVGSALPGPVAGGRGTVAQSLAVRQALPPVCWPHHLRHTPLAVCEARGGGGTDPNPNPNPNP